MKKTHNNNLVLGALCCALLAASSCSVALAAGREAALSSSPSVAAAITPDATTLPGLQIGEGFGRLAGAFASALDRLRPRIIAPSASVPAAPVASKLDGRPPAAAADAAAAAASKTTPPVVPVADPVDYTFAPKLEVKPKLKVFAPLQPTLAVAVAPSFANALAESLTTSFTPTATVAKTGTLNNAVETVYTPPAGGKK